MTRRIITTACRLSVECLEDRRLLVAPPAGFTVEQVGSLQSITATAALEDGRLLVAQKTGGLFVVENDQLDSQAILELPVNTRSERGLLGVEPDPDFQNNSFVYIYYTVDRAPIHNRVSRFTMGESGIDPSSEAVLLDLDPLLGPGNHNGGAIHFGVDGKLYIAAGDDGRRENAQSLSSTHGKMLRINSNGTIPADNPFLAQTTGVHRAIWALGLRNPFTFAVDPATGRMLINDVGELDWEEINVGAAGANYGWPTVEGPGGQGQFVDPVFAYSHDESAPLHGCAIVGGAFYRPEEPLLGEAAFGEEYVGDYFFGDFCQGWIYRLDGDTLDSGSPQVSRFADLEVPFSSTRDIRTTPQGALYYAGPANGIFKVERPTVFLSAPSAALAGEPMSITVTAGDPATTGYQIDWDGDGVIDETFTAAPNETLIDGLQASHTFTEQGPQTIHVVAIGLEGPLGAPATAAIHVAAPGVTFLPQSGDLIVSGTTSNDHIYFDKSPRDGKVYFRVNEAGSGSAHVWQGPYDVTGKLIAFGREGWDRISASPELNSPVEFHGGPGKDRLYGGLFDDFFSAGDGRDFIDAAAGDDVVLAEEGNDVVRGGSGHDLLFGGSGDDYLRAGHGDDLLRGGAGRDLLLGSFGDDILSGGADRDRLYGHDGLNLMLGGDGSDLLDGRSGGENILIPSATHHDGNDAGLLALLAQWKVGGSIIDRTNNLRGDSGNPPHHNLGFNLQSNITALADDDWDHLVSGAAADWLLPLNRKDILYDANANDVIENV